MRELGIEPGAELRELEQAILRHDPELAPPTREVAPGAGSLPARTYGSGAPLALGVAIAAVASRRDRSRRRDPFEEAYTGAAAPVHGKRRRRRRRGHGTSPRVGASSTRALRRSPTAPGRSGSLLLTLAPSHGSRRRRGRSWPRSRSTGPAQGLAATSRSLWAVGSSPTDSSLTLDQIDPTFDTVARVPPPADGGRGRQRVDHRGAGLGRHRASGRVPDGRSTLGAGGR